MFWSESLLESLVGVKTEILIALLVLVAIRGIISYFLSRPAIPGPFPWPIVGNAISLGDAPQIVMQDMAKRYGSIYLMKLGSKDIVVLNNYKVIRDALQRQGQVFAGRPAFNSYRNISQGKGVVFNDGTTLGPKWSNMKRIIIKLLHRFTASPETRGLLCRHVRTETMHLVKQLCEREEQVAFGMKKKRAEDVIQVGVANLMCAMMFGHRYEYSNKEFQDLVSLNREFGQVIGPGSEIDVMSTWIRYIPKFAKILKTFDFLNNRTNNWMIARSKEHRETYIHGVVRDIVDTYIAESIDDPTNTFDEEDVVSLTTDLFGAGQDTLSTVMLWIFVYLVYFPDYQQRIKDELDEHLKGQRLPTIDDSKHFPFTEAVLHEIFRHSSFTPCTIPHETSEPTTLGQYHIPKSTIVFVNQYAANRDEHEWSDPDTFDPCRFLKADGTLIHKPHERYLSFSTGIRKCPGGDISRLLLIHFIATFFSVAEIVPESGHTPTLEGVYNLSMRPKELKFKARLRNRRVFETAFVHLEKVAVPVHKDKVDILESENIKPDPVHVNGWNKTLETEFSDNDFETMEKVSRVMRKRKSRKLPFDDINGNQIYGLFPE